MLTERALFSAAKSVLSGDVNAFDATLARFLCTDELTDEERESILSLHTSFAGDCREGVDVGRRLKWIFMQNATAVGSRQVLHEDSFCEQMMHLLPTFSRFNHSCEPNCSFDGEKMRTLKRVPKGVELTQSYIDDERSSGYCDRQQDLWVRCFMCRCEWCEREEKTLTSTQRTWLYGEGDENVGFLKRQNKWSESVRRAGLEEEK